MPEISINIMIVAIQAVAAQVKELRTMASRDDAQPEEMKLLEEWVEAAEDLERAYRHRSAHRDQPAAVRQARPRLKSPSRAHRLCKARRRGLPPVGYLVFSASRISRSRTVSSGVTTSTGGAARFSRFICLTIRKMMKARMRKLMVTVTKLP